MLEIPPDRSCSHVRSSWCLLSFQNKIPCVNFQSWKRQKGKKQVNHVALLPMIVAHKSKKKDQIHTFEERWTKNITEPCSVESCSWIYLLNWFCFIFISGVPNSNLTVRHVHPTLGPLGISGAAGSHQSQQDMGMMGKPYNQYGAEPLGAGGLEELRGNCGLVLYKKLPLPVLIYCVHSVN